MDEDVNAVSNLSIVVCMIEEAHSLMTDSQESHRTPKGDSGYILKYDPDHRSFKEAIKLIIFVGVALEAMWHMKAVQLRSKTFAEKMDRDCKSVSARFACIGLTDDTFLTRIDHYYDVRRQIVHEKAYSAAYKKSLFLAQDEARSAYDLFHEVKNFFIANLEPPNRSARD